MIMQRKKHISHAIIYVVLTVLSVAFLIPILLICLNVHIYI